MTGVAPDGDGGAPVNGDQRDERRRASEYRGLIVAAAGAVRRRATWAVKHLESQRGSAA